MELTPFYKAAASWMPWCLAAQSVTMSLVQLTFSLPEQIEGLTQEIITKTPRRRRPEDRDRTLDQVEWDREKNRYLRIAHFTNVLGTLSYLGLLAKSEPLALFASYLCWTGHYIAQLKANPAKKNIAQEHSWEALQESFWLALYGFGALTCLASAILAQGGIPLTTAIVITRVAATALSQVETLVFFYQFLFQTSQLAKQAYHVANSSLLAAHTPT